MKNAARIREFQQQAPWTQRDIVSEATLRPYEGRNKVFLIDPADGLSPSGSNSLLKTLEEPTRDTTFLLLTRSPDLLLPTIKSRSQHIYVGDTPTPSAFQKHVPVGEKADEKPLDQVLLADDGFAHFLNDLRDPGAGIGDLFIELFEFGFVHGVGEDTRPRIERRGETFLHCE